ncbi:hypothetical protein IWX80_000749 [Flavobacterium sp. CAN_S2]|jgi:hypothetical protein
MPTDPSNRGITIVATFKNLTVKLKNDRSINFEGSLQLPVLLNWNFIYS